MKEEQIVSHEFQMDVLGRSYTSLGGYFCNREKCFKERARHTTNNILLLGVIIQNLDLGNQYIH